MPDLGSGGGGGGAAAFDGVEPLPAASAPTKRHNAAIARVWASPYFRLSVQASIGIIIISECPAAASECSAADAVHFLNGLTLLR